MDKNESQNPIKKLSIIDKMVIISWLIFLANGIFTFITGIGYSFATEPIEMLITEFFWAIGVSLLNNSPDSMLLSECFVIIQIIVLIMCKTTFVEFNKKLKIINIVLWICLSAPLILGIFVNLFLPSFNIDR